MILALPAVWLLVYVFNLGIYGVWLGLLFGSVITMVIAFIWIQRTINKLEKGIIRIHKV
ncbi:MAG: hypothetical protein PF693_03590 [Spirochaetia bacterium]|jgi:Na+-driven multidrug efflux pump|nr:hypothetical protein [Spirochaetia bacterium]